MACQVQMRCVAPSSSVAIKTRDSQHLKNGSASLATASRHLSFLASSQADARHCGLGVAAARKAAVRGPVSVRADVHVKDGEKLAAMEYVPRGSVSIILLAGGVGKRMGASIPKQYLPIHNQPIALYSFFTFASLDAVKEVVVVAEVDYRNVFSDAAARAGLSLPVKFALPGKERQDSVYNGLQEIDDSSVLVAVHDSARPLVTADDTLRVFHDAFVHGAAVLAVRSKATIKEADPSGFVARTLDRKLLWEMQTPQVMKPQLLREGFKLVQREGLEVTDDVSIVEYLKRPVRITEGAYTNIKVTTPDDLLLAERIIGSTPTSILA